MQVAIHDSPGRKPHTLPVDDVLAAVLDEQTGALISKRPCDPFRHFECLLHIDGTNVFVNALDELYLSGIPPHPKSGSSDSGSGSDGGSGEAGRGRRTVSAP